MSHQEQMAFMVELRCCELDGHSRLSQRINLITGDWP